jgi:pyridoxamine 5'-phosphate oxidase
MAPDVDAPDPIARFQEWLAEAEAAGVALANAMTLATVDGEGRPAARMVLLKGVGEAGFEFFTNYESAKGADLAAHPQAALVFWWGALERQVRVTGPVAKLSTDESEAYFATRPLGSRLGAWASHQSQPVTNRQVLEDEMAAAAARYGDEVPLPPWWGGYRVTPETIEFWQGRPDRLHDRLLFTRLTGSGWRTQILSP